MNNINIHNLIKVCKKCGNEFQVRRISEFESRIYCSNKCKINSTKKGVPSKCETCGKEILVLPCRKDKNRYCSVKCRQIGHKKIKDDSLRQCNKCFGVFPISQFCKSNLHTRSYRCRECEKKRSYDENRRPQGRFRFSKTLAKRRSLEWTISRDEYYNLLSYNCHYCGNPLDVTGIGLDRKDNYKGYSNDNVVPCCGRCNTTRSDNFSYDEMLILAETIKLILKNRATCKENPAR